MKNMRLTQLLSVAVLAILTSGCASTLALKDHSSVYDMRMINSAPKIIIGDFKDRRVNKSNVGKICLLTLKTDKDINLVLTDMIARRLRDENFNIQKVNMVRKGEKEEVIRILRDNNGAVYLTGEIFNFGVHSFDAVLEKAKGRASFGVKVYGHDGELKFAKKYKAYADNYIGLDIKGEAKAVEKTLEAMVDSLFRGKSFRIFLSEFKEVPGIGADVTENEISTEMDRTVREIIEKEDVY